MPKTLLAIIFALCKRNISWQTRSESVEVHPCRVSLEVIGNRAATVLWELQAKNHPARYAAKPPNGPLNAF